MANLVTLNAENMMEFVDYGVSIVILSTKTCKPCVKLKKETMENNNISFKVGTSNVDEPENFDISDTFNVTASPTILLFEDGELCARFTGYKTQRELEDFVKENV